MLIAIDDFNGKELLDQLKAQGVKATAIDTDNDDVTFCVAQTETIERMENIMVEYCSKNQTCGLGEIVADLRLMLLTEHNRTR